MMRKKIVVANWKMNLSLAEGEQLFKNIIKEPQPYTYNHNVIICPPYTHIARFANIIKEADKDNISLGAQNCFDKVSGAYTGEVSVNMLKEAGARTVIVGHSERRQHFNESNGFIKNKIDALLVAKLQPIFCCGEPLKIREANQQNEFVYHQLEESLFHLTNETIANNIIIAYEPIWAIGTGKTASLAQAQEMHYFIRNVLVKQFGDEAAYNIPILYGGSCTATNACDLFSCADVDGGLIGGASLKFETFMPIIQALK